MRINAPVTDKELEIADGSMIVSKTDTKGRIAYVNRDFIDISGFAEDELIGQAHNIVRHPGMPPEAFADMWRSLKEGRPWIGIVKNRCKNGDHYWVQANVTPLRENGVVTGYMSVRTKPTRAQIEAAASAYAEIINGNPRKLAIHRGQVVSGKSWFSGRGQSLGVRMGVIAAVAGLTIGAVDAAGAAGLLNNWFASIAAECVGTGLIGYLVWRLHRDTVRELEATRAWLFRMAEGDLRNAPVIKREDEIGAVMESVLSLQIKVGFDIEDMARMSAEHRRIGMALENSEAHVMIADETGKVIYLNSTLRKMFERNAEQLRKSLPDFDPAKLLGANIDVFHRDPKHQRRIIDGLKDSHRAEVNVAGLIFGLVASPVFDARGRRVGTVVEWKDLTAIKGEVKALVSGAAAGDFTMRGNPQNHSGEFRDFVVMLNKLMESADAGISATADVLNKLADGDLSARVKGEMEGRFKDLQQSTNTTLDRLSGIVRQIHEASNIINVAAKEIASGNTDLSQRTEEQASSLEQTAAALEELSSTVKLNAENARHANQFAVNASAVAGKGGDVVRQVVNTMGDISESSKKIADIIGVIDGIAFQTNILALNAAVEAARAGEQGRGFAVVATEVRNLAQRSANAAKEIKQLIENSVGTVEAGSKLVNDAGATMDEVVAAVKQVTEFMSEITTASNEQSGGIEQVNQAIMQMDEVTQQNAAMVEQAAAAAESLEEQAGVLVNSVSVFKMAANDASLAAPASVNERRGANRTKNVTRIPAGNKPAAKPNGGAATGTDGWERY